MNVKYFKSKKAQEKADLEILNQIQSDSRTLSKDEYEQLKNKAYLKLENQIFFSADDAIICDWCAFRLLVKLL